MSCCGSPRDAEKKEVTKAATSAAGGAPLSSGAKPDTGREKLDENGLTAAEAAEVDALEGELDGELAKMEKMFGD
jgi:hypothetical protein